MPTSTSVDRLSATAISLAHRLLTLHRTATALTLVTGTTAYVLAPRLYADYRAYLDLGEGGVPHNAFGWLLACAAGLFGRETTSTDEYTSDPDGASFLAALLPRRVGERPKLGRHVIPHRQLEQFADDHIAQELPAVLTELSTANPETLELRKSVHERHTQALFLAPALPSPHAVADSTWREIAHIHIGNDNSLHVVLSPRDCKEVIEKGWGERHPLSGRVKGVPKEYLMVYSPRNTDELEIIRMVVKAAAQFMTGREIL